jgi:hypothetical protein
MTQPLRVGGRKIEWRSLLDRLQQQGADPVIDRQYGGDTPGVPSGECHRFLADARSVGTHLEDRWYACGRFTANDHRNVPPLEEGAEVQAPLLAQGRQQDRQSVKPGTYRVAITSRQACSEHVLHDDILETSHHVSVSAVAIEVLRMLRTLDGDARKAYASATEVTPQVTPEANASR